MKLGVSNLAWATEVDDQAFDMIASRGFTGVEVAPTRIAGWADLDTRALASYRARLRAAGLEASSLQAIFYGCPQAQLLGDAAEFAFMQEHLRRVGGIAAALGAGVAVFGAPANRRRGDLSVADATELATTRFRQLGDIAAAEAVVLAIEPVPTCYGSDFLTRVDDVAHLVSACGHDAIRLHLDCACIALGGDQVAAKVAEYGGVAVHYHAAEPELGPFSPPRCDHAAAAAALAASQYCGWVVIEMREHGLDALDAALVYIAALEQESSAFFFEKKKQKTFTGRHRPNK